MSLFQHKGFGLDAIVLTNSEIKKIIDENEGEWDLIIDIIKEGQTLYEKETKIKRTYS